MLFHLITLAKVIFIFFLFWAMLTQAKFALVTTENFKIKFQHCILIKSIIVMNWYYILPKTFAANELTKDVLYYYRNSKCTSWTFLWGSLKIFLYICLFFHIFSKECSATVDLQFISLFTHWWYVASINQHSHTIYLPSHFTITEPFRREIVWSKVFVVKGK